MKKLYPTVVLVVAFLSALFYFRLVLPPEKGEPKRDDSQPAKLSSPGKGQPEKSTSRAGKALPKFSGVKQAELDQVSAPRPFSGDPESSSDIPAIEKREGENSKDRSDTNALEDCPPVDIPSAWPLADSADDLPPFSGYINGTDRMLKHRAMLDDGYAQHLYAERLINRIGARLHSIQNRDSIDRNTRYLIEHEVKLMRSFYILAIKNRAKKGPGRLVEALEMRSLDSNVVEIVAWGVIDAALGGDMLEFLERSDYISVASAQRLRGLRRAQKYIDIFNLRFLKSPTESSGEGNNGESAGRTSKDCLLDYAKNLEQEHKSEDASAGSVSSGTQEHTERTVQAGEYAAALTRLKAYERDSRRLAGIEGVAATGNIPERRRKLHERFHATRLELISALQAGNKDALPVLVSMHLDYKREYDPLEAATWKMIANGIFNDSTSRNVTGDLFGMTESELAAEAKTLSRLYVSMYELD